MQESYLLFAHNFPQYVLSCQFHVLQVKKPVLPTNISVTMETAFLRRGCVTLMMTVETNLMRKKSLIAVRPSINDCGVFS